MIWWQWLLLWVGANVFFAVVLGVIAPAVAAGIAFFGSIFGALIHSECRWQAKPGDRDARDDLVALEASRLELRCLSTSPSTTRESEVA